MIGLVSFVVKEKAFLSDSLVATLIGIAFGNVFFLFLGPLSVKLLDPTMWTDLNLFILQFTDLLINIQIMAATIALTRDFWKSRWRTMLIFLGPVMIFMWLVTAVILYLLLPINWFNCMILAACMAPTDPVN
jgi:NhaP-type Na+/H+ or K+/H+ antiporter